MAKKEKNIVGDMPHSLEAEQALLGCFLLDSKIQTEVASSLNEEDFFIESHKHIFNAMREIIGNNKTVDIVTLTDALEKSGELEQAGGISYIAELTNIVFSSSNYERYLEIVQRDSMLRKLIVGSADIIENSRQSTDKGLALAYAEKKIFDISQTEDTSTMSKIDTVIPAVMNRLDELSNGNASSMGVMTKYKGLDRLLNGLHKSDLLILAARPSVGKTTFAMNIVENVARQGYTCAVFSLEMSKEQLVQRMMCSVSGVSMSNAMRGQMSKSEWLKMAKAREILLNSKIYIDDSSLITAEEILSKCRRLKRKAGLDLVMIDYIQLMSPGNSKKSNSENRQQEISEISRNLKILAKEINVPVIALSQLSRAVEQRKGRPQLSDLRESGAIEQDADIVMFIHRPDKGATEKEVSEGKIKKNVAEIIVEKHRNGEQGMVELYFKGECTKFLNIDKETGEIEDEDGKTGERVKPITNVEGLEDLPIKPKAQANSDDMPPFGEEPPFESDEDSPIKSVDDELYGN